MVYLDREKIVYPYGTKMLHYKDKLRQYCNNQCSSVWEKWNESGFRPPLCTYRLNWARRTSWGWWDDWDDTVLQTQDLKFEPWRSEAEHATSRSRRLPTILTFTHGWGRNIFVSLKPPRPGTEPRTLAWKAAVLTTTLGPPPSVWEWLYVVLWTHERKLWWLIQYRGHTSVIQIDLLMAKV